MAYKRKYYKKRYYNNNNNVQEYNIPIVIGFFVIGLITFFELHPIISNIIIIITIIWIPIVIYLIRKNIINKKERCFNIRTIEEMKKLHWREFEYFIEFVFRKKWFKANVRQWINDWWIDIDAELNWQKYLIQIKKWTKYTVWRPKLQEFYWAIMSVSKDTLWIFITTTRLTSEAQVFAVENNIEIWDDSNLESYIAEFTWIEFVEKKSIFNFMNQKDISKSNAKVINIKQSIEEQIIENQEIENNLGKVKENINLICLKCWWKMVLRKAKKGKHSWEEFYWCINFPKCRNIIKL